MAINIHIPDQVILKPCITVFGVGGAGGNAVNNMIASNLEGARFVVANTDAQALEYSLAERKVQLGTTITRGLGAGALPEVGRAAAEEAMEQIMENLQGSNMVFITAGMGGGTGTGSAPVIARAAKENGILTVGVVTKPFHFEGSHRMKIAEFGLQELQKYVDTLIVIPNQNLFRIANERTTFADAFKMADDVLHAGVRGVTDLMIMPGLINLDFADIRAVMSEMGKAMMGTGEAEGDGRATRAAEAAIANPLLDHCSMKGARGVLINITGGTDMTLFEVDEAANRIRDEVDQDANIIFGSTFNTSLDGRIRVSVVATGIDSTQENKYNKMVFSTTTKPGVSEAVNQFARTVASSPELTPPPPLSPEPIYNTSIFEEMDVSPARRAPAQGSTYSTAQQPLVEDDLLVAEREEVVENHAQDYKFPQNISMEAAPQRASQYEDLFEEPSHYQPRANMRAEPEPKAAPRPRSLFERMASSVGLIPAKSAAPNNRAAYDHKIAREDERLSVADDFLGEDVLDIPAFLRRKK